MFRHIPVISWFDKDTIRHLRLPFSFYLLPVYLFSLSQAISIAPSSAITGFVILHFFVFPATNGYNSYQDKDETSIGGLKYPPKVSVNLLYASLMLEVIAILSALLVTPVFSVMIFIFLLMSHLYSYRGIRLKRYPITAFMIVFIFQGAFVYMMSAECIQPHSLAGLFNTGQILCLPVSSLFIGSMYPLTQIYQHKADKEDGVISISYMLGYKGTFVFSGALFAMATTLLIVYFAGISRLLFVLLFIACILPVVLRLSRWFAEVRKDPARADFENTMVINRISAVCMNLFFILIFFLNHKFGTR
ncbi:MAG TPA: UbiA family prenyltransferase [Bacteroidales bacterium]|nr:UbiA family prenyltransferase [Bacteroidales bacterium]